MTTAADSMQPPMQDSVKRATSTTSSNNSSTHDNTTPNPERPIPPKVLEHLKQLTEKYYHYDPLECEQWVMDDVAMLDNDAMWSHARSDALGTTGYEHKKPNDPIMWLKVDADIQEGSLRAAQSLFDENFNVLQREWQPIFIVGTIVATPAPGVEIVYGAHKSGSMLVKGRDCLYVRVKRIFHDGRLVLAGRSLNLPEGSVLDPHYVPTHFIGTTVIGPPKAADANGKGFHYTMLQHASAGGALNKIQGIANTMMSKMQLKEVHGIRKGVQHSSLPVGPDLVDNEPHEAQAPVANSQQPSNGQVLNDSQAHQQAQQVSIADQQQVAHSQQDSSNQHNTLLTGPEASQ